MRHDCQERNHLWRGHCESARPDPPGCSVRRTGPNAAVSGWVTIGAGGLTLLMDAGEYRAGAKEDFDRLYRASYQRVFRTLLAITGDAATAEDCTQEAFLRAFRAWKEWKRDAPAEAWVHRIAVNVALSHRRRQRLREAGELVRRLGIPR